MGIAFEFCQTHAAERLYNSGDEESEVKAHLFASINSLYSFFILTPETVLHIQAQELASFRFQMEGYGEYMEGMEQWH